MKLAAVGSNCIDYYNNVEGGTAYPGGGPVNMAVSARAARAYGGFPGDPSGR